MKDTDIIEDVELDELLDEADKTLKELEEAKCKKEEEEDDSEDMEDDDKEDLDEAKKVKKEADDEEDDKEDEDEEELDEAKKVKKEAEVDPDEVDGKDDDDKEDDGEGMDKPGDEDKDVDNDGDSDKSDEFLTKRRKAIAKSVAKESVDFMNDINNIISEEDSLSEDFKEKAGTLFEVALTSRLKEETERLQEEFDDRLVEETAKIRESLEEKIDNYLTYAVESWVEDNKIAIENGLRTEVAESFIDALKNVFVEHYIEVPETKKDLVSELETKLTEAEEALSEKGKQAETLAEQVEKLVREKILAEATESLADTQGARLKELVEDIEFVNEETFRKKVSTIKECYFADGDSEDEIVEDDKSSYTKTEVIVEDSQEADLSPTMKNYLQALGRIRKASAMSGTK